MANLGDNPDRPGSLGRNFLWMTWSGVISIANSLLVWVFMARMRDIDDVGRFTQEPFDVLYAMQSREKVQPFHWTLDFLRDPTIWCKYLPCTHYEKCCPSKSSPLGIVCANIAFDPKNCGGCGIHCRPDQTCFQHKCWPRCVTHDSCDIGLCVDWPERWVPGAGKACRRGAAPRRPMIPISSHACRS